MFTGKVLYNTTPATSAATLFTSSGGDGVREILCINGTGSAATVSLTLVRKGGTPTDTEAVVLANALSVPANSYTQLLNPQLHSAYDELLFENGDYLYGLQGTSSAVTVMVAGS